ncbi:septum formation initiator family protein [Mesobacillus maritimus]|uniref:FtsB family cell division protein n=1 Tax=Mesobacillus maritimus TaxID=1643336 RepID=UPI00203EB5B3|nr:septum formation initiator family protein [Mesobacillus maritimus]MCM3588557.1 septum formation initiator family protein [Mesobacillus maritimus]MCM3671574.1 septum formation initiator family protein [Mesobacillus maritimus]
MNAIRKRKIAKIENEYVQQSEQAMILEKRKRKMLFRRLAVFSVFFLIVSIIMISTFLSRTSALEEKLAEREQLEQQLANLEREQKHLEEEIVKLNDEEYIAKLARRDYFLSQEGEIIFNIPEKE